MIHRLIIAVLMVLGLSGASQASDVPQASFVAAIDRAIAGERLIQAEAMLMRTGVNIDEADRGRLQASLLLAHHRDREAYAGFQMLLTDFSSTDCRVQAGAGIAALRLGDAKSAESRLRQAITTCPDAADAWGALAVVEDQAGRWDSSTAFYARALALKPDDPALLNNAGVSLLAQRRIVDAELLFRRALSMDPGNERAKNNLDIAKVTSGARPTFDAEYDSQTRAERLNNAGYAALLAGDDAAAAEYFAEAIKTNPFRFDAAEANLQSASYKVQSTQ